MSAFGSGLIFSISERNILAHFVQQKDMSVSAVLAFNFLRFSFYGILQSGVVVLLSLSLMHLAGEGLDTVVTNVAVFSAAYGYFCFALTMAFPVLYGSQLILLTFLLMFYFSGILFPWENISTFFKVLHYGNPFFYCLAACTHLVLSAFQPNCGDKDYPYLVCATNEVLPDLVQIQDLGSMASQFFSAGFLAIGMLLLWFVQRRPDRAPSREELKRRGLLNRDAIEGFLTNRKGNSESWEC